MKYFRLLQYQPHSLTELAQNCWLNSLMKVLHSFHIWQQRAEESESLEVSWNVDLQGIAQYQDYLLPSALQETLYHKGCDVLFSSHEFLQDGDLFPHFFQCVWRSNFSTFLLPKSVKDRVKVLNWILLEDHPVSLSIQVYQDRCTTSGQLPSSLEESYLIKRIIRTISATLTVLSLWQKIDDVLCQIIGQNCHHLNTLDIRKSRLVSHFGVRQLLVDDNESTRLCQTLREVNLLETGLPSFSSILMIEKCRNLTHLFIDEDTWTGVWNDWKNLARQELPLQILYVPWIHLNVSDLRAFPELKKITVRMERTHEDRFSTEKYDFKLSNLKEMNLLNCHLQHLTPIMGTNLEFLSLSDVSSKIQCKVIAKYCPALETLQVIRSSLVMEENENEIFFPRLRKLYFFSVHCQSSPLLKILSASPQIEDVQANLTQGVTDAALLLQLNNGRFLQLKRLVFTVCLCPNRHDEGNQPSLTLTSVLSLFESCQSLQSLGDLRLWNLNSDEFALVTQKLKNMSEK